MTTTYEDLETYDAYRMGERMIAQRRPADAARALRVVVDREPDHGAAWELLGRAHFAAAHLAPAEQAFRRLAELEPTSGWAHAALARTLERQNRADEAEQVSRLAAALGESTADASRIALTDPGSQPEITVDLSERLGRG